MAGGQRRHLYAVDQTCQLSAELARICATSRHGVVLMTARLHGTRLSQYPSRLGAGRRVLPDISRSVRAQRASAQAEQSCCRGTRRRRSRAITAVICWGIVEHLDHLVDLGINAIYLTPIFQSACNHRYHTHDYYQVDPMLGGNAALRSLIEAAHARGHPHHARWRLQPREPRLLSVPRHPGKRTAFRMARLVSHPGLAADALRRGPASQLHGLGQQPGLAQVQHGQPGRARVS